jgi:GTP-binding protein Era
MITDQPERAVIAELIREKSIASHPEMKFPHSVAVEVTEVKDRGKRPG